MLSYQIQGTGAPLVLLHGYLSDSNYWRSVVPELSKHYTVITIDLLGFGRSPKPKTAQYTIDEHADAVTGTIKKLTGEPVLLVGHSMGALIAAQIAASHPKQISRVVLCNMPLFRDAKQAREVVMRTSPLYRIALYSPLSRVVWPLVKSFFIAKQLAPGPTGAFSIRHNYHSRTRSLTNTVESTNAVQLMTTIPVPTLLINGTYDRRVYRDTLEATTLPDHITVKWAETGHHTIYRAPHEILDELIS